MNLHEYQAKEILAAREYRSQRLGLLRSPGSPVAARELKSEKVVIKAQAHTGGRGKAGGVALVSSEGDIRTKASEILGRTFGDISDRTGRQTRERSVGGRSPSIDREMYLVPSWTEVPAESRSWRVLKAVWKLKSLPGNHGKNYYDCGGSPARTFAFSGENSGI